MNPYSPISRLYGHEFLGQNSKKWIFRLLLDIWKSGSLCGVHYSVSFLKCLPVHVYYGFGAGFNHLVGGRHNVYSNTRFRCSGDLGCRLIGWIFEIHAHHDLVPYKNEWVVISLLWNIRFTRSCSTLFVFFLFLQWEIFFSFCEWTFFSDSQGSKN